MLVHKTEVEYPTPGGEGRHHFSEHILCARLPLRTSQLLPSLAQLVMRSRVFISVIDPSQQSQGTGLLLSSFYRGKVTSGEGRCLSKQD